MGGAGVIAGAAARNDATAIQPRVNALERAVRQFPQKQLEQKQDNKPNSKVLGKRTRDRKVPPHELKEEERVKTEAVVGKSKESGAPTVGLQRQASGLSDVFGDSSSSDEEADTKKEERPSTPSEEEEEEPPPPPPPLLPQEKEEELEENEWQDGSDKSAREKTDQKVEVIEDDSPQVKAQWKALLKAKQEAELEKYRENIEDNVRLGEDGWKDRYYNDKLKMEDIQHGGGREEVYKAYTQGLCWVMKYYYEGVASWKWFYPFHYGPFASDLVNMDRYGAEISIHVHV
jgi:5'-3' exonuclease